VTVQIAQIQTPEPSLFSDHFAQNTPSHPFEQYLEQEQKRLSFLGSPFSGFNFDSWFSYPDFSTKNDLSSPSVDLFSDLFSSSNEPYQSNNYTSNQPEPSIANQVIEGLTNNNYTQSPQIVLQDLLQKTGWLVPNLEASALLYQAQTEGKLLNKLDLQFLVDQIISQIKIVKEKGKVELMVGLKPENLGEIILTLTSKSGMVSIQIQAPEETKKLIQAELRELEMALKRAKINFSEIKIEASKEVLQHA